MSFVESNTDSDYQSVNSNVEFDEALEDTSENEDIILSTRSSYLGAGYFSYAEQKIVCFENFKVQKSEECTKIMERCKQTI